jgi:hypothetical protein
MYDSAPMFFFGLISRLKIGTKQGTISAAGWPDEFVKKIAQNVAQPIFLVKIIA